MLDLSPIVTWKGKSACEQSSGYVKFTNFSETDSNIKCGLFYFEDRQKHKISCPALQLNLKAHIF